MRYKRDPEVINNRCTKLMELGFEILHEDSRVCVSPEHYETHLVIDFSAIDESKFLDYAIQSVFKLGKNIGRRSLKSDLKNLLEDEEFEV